MKYLLLPLVIGSALYAFCRENPSLTPALDPAINARVELARTRDQLAETQKELEATRARLAENSRAERKRPGWFDDRLQAATGVLAKPDADGSNGHRR
jgi:hypothetical protein